MVNLSKISLIIDYFLIEKTDHDKKFQSKNAEIQIIAFLGIRAEKLEYYLRKFFL